MPLVGRSRACTVSDMDGSTEEQTEVSIDGTSYLLDPRADPQDVQDRLAHAAQTSGTFVDLDLEGDRRASVVVGQRSRVFMMTQTVHTGSDASVLMLNDHGAWDLF